ncbi:MAG: hypothetical protein Q9170_000592 [Blastenia crenularia]
MYSLITSILRGGLTALLALLIAIFLFISAPSKPYQRDHTVQSSRLLNQGTVHESARLPPVSLRVDEISHNSSAGNLGSSLMRRTEIDDEFTRLVCKGDILINMITNGQSKTHLPTQRDLDNGWSFNNYEFNPNRNILPALNDLGIPRDEHQVSYQEIHQDEQFTISRTGNQRYDPTGGRYNNAYISSGVKSTIVAMSNHSPRFEARAGQVIPDLWRWSDVVWFAWAKIAGDKAGQLRFVIQENITTEQTRRMMEYIEGVHNSPDYLRLPWPGHLYDLGSKEGKALLATPHGVGLAWMIAEHNNVLGRKYPVVCIFSENKASPFSRYAVEYFMIWELRDATETEDDMDTDVVKTCRDMI